MTYHASKKMDETFKAGASIRIAMGAYYEEEVNFHAVVLKEFTTRQAMEAYVVAKGDQSFLGDFGPWLIEQGYIEARPEPIELHIGRWATDVMAENLSHITTWEKWPRD